MPTLLEVPKAPKAMQLDQTDLKIYADLFERFGIPSGHQSEFARFVEHGEASSSFTEFLDKNSECQKAVEQAFLRRMEDVRQILRELTSNREVEVAAAN